MLELKKRRTLLYRSRENLWKSRDTNRKESIQTDRESFLKAFEELVSDKNKTTEEKKQVITSDNHRSEKSKGSDIAELLNEFHMNELSVKQAQNRLEVVEENELFMEQVKPSKRIRPKFPGERRYSRISMVKELALTREPCINLRWGMNLD